jgi:hypothetical protein
MTKETLTTAIQILKTSNWRSKNVRNAVSHLEALRRSAPYAEANWENFHDATGAVWEMRTLDCSINGALIVSRPADFISPSGSMYWRGERGVYRLSDHWGLGIRSCNWWLRGQYPRYTTVDVTALAFCEYRHFIKDDRRWNQSRCAEKEY